MKKDYFAEKEYRYGCSITGSSRDYAWLPGHWISDQQPPGEGSMFYQDAFGGQVVAGDFAPQAPMKRLPEYAMQACLTTCGCTCQSFGFPRVPSSRAFPPRWGARSSPVCRLSFAR